MGAEPLSPDLADRLADTIAAHIARAAQPFIIVARRVDDDAIAEMRAAFIATAVGTFDRAIEYGRATKE
jgi:hypothetical protein